MSKSIARVLCDQIRGDDERVSVNLCKRDPSPRHSSRYVREYLTWRTACRFDSNLYFYLDA